MNNRAVLYAQAVRGPILLITVGALFAIQQAGVLPLSRTWPLFIIVFGVMKLIERLVLPRPPYPPSYPPYPPSAPYPPAGGAR